MRQSLSIALALSVFALVGCGKVPAVVLQTTPVESVGSTDSLRAERTLQSLADSRVSAIPPRFATSRLDVSYGSHPEQKLDIYGSRERNARRPVVIWVHGGGWKMGDKKNKMEVKKAYFQSLGYVLVSINYRLANPRVSEGRRAMHPVQIRDVCAAIGWVRQNIASHGGDPSAIALMGHSAGAHLVALAGTHRAYLAEAVGPVGLGALRGVVGVDTAAYDLMNTSGTNNERLISNAFGDNPRVRVDASPLFQVASGRQTPPFLVMVQGSAARVSQSYAFFKAAQNADPRAGGDQFKLVKGYSHSAINDAIGKPQETQVTPPITAFLRGVFGR